MGEFFDWREICNITAFMHDGDYNDWLYGTVTSRCGCGDNRDNDPSTAFSRGFIVLLTVLATVAVLVFARQRRLARIVKNGVGEPPQQTGQAVDAEVPYTVESQGIDIDNDFIVGCAERTSDGADQTRVEAHPRTSSLHSARSTASIGAVSELVQDSRAPKKERLWYIDYARIICVACVVTEHAGGEIYADRNIAWVQQWVLPYLYVISGFSFMLSSGSIWAYLLRLVVVFLVGTLANWIADAITGRDWKHDFGNTIFQMAYVLVIAFLSFFTVPLRQALRWRHQNKDASPTLLTLAWLGASGALTIMLLVVGFVRGSFANDDQPHAANGTRAFVVYGPYVAVTYVACFYLCILTCATGCDGRAGWVLMAFIYIHRMAIAYSRGGHPVNADLFMLGMLVQKVPLHGAATVAQTAREYWPIVFVVLLLLSTPGVTGRCDLHPHYHGWERIRFYTIEWILMVLLLCGVYNTSDSRNITPWLNIWALYAYCLHVAWARLFWRPMYGALFTYLAIPGFYFLYRYLSKHQRNRTAEAEGERE